MVLRSEWARAFLGLCGFPFHPESVVAIVAWCDSERSYTLPPHGAQWNPLDTTEPWPNATDFNDVHVRNYATFEDGLEASKATLFNGYYSNIVSAFMLRQDADIICDQVSRSPWGSKPDRGLVAAVRANLQEFDVPITGEGSTPTPPLPPEPSPEPSPEPPAIGADMLQAIDPETGGTWVCDPKDGTVYAFDKDGGTTGRFFGNLTDPSLSPVGHVFAFVGKSDGYVIITRTDDGEFHPYNFPLSQPESAPVVTEVPAP